MRSFSSARVWSWRRQLSPAWRSAAPPPRCPARCAPGRSSQPSCLLGSNCKRCHTRGAAQPSAARSGPTAWAVSHTPAGWVNGSTHLGFQSLQLEQPLLAPHLAKLAVLHAAPAKDAGAPQARAVAAGTPINSGALRRLSERAAACRRRCGARSPLSTLHPASPGNTDAPMVPAVAALPGRGLAAHVGTKAQLPLLNPAVALVAGRAPRLGVLQGGGVRGSGQRQAGAAPAWKGGSRGKPRAAAATTAATHAASPPGRRCAGAWRTAAAPSGCGTAPAAAGAACAPCAAWLAQSKLRRAGEPVDAERWERRQSPRGGESGQTLGARAATSPPSSAPPLGRQGAREKLGGHGLLGRRASRELSVPI